MCGAAVAQAIQLGLEYAPAPPFDAGTPRSAPAAVVAAVRARGAAMRAAREEIVARLVGENRILDDPAPTPPPTSGRHLRPDPSRRGGT
jgi:hypothetical protein